MSHFPVRVLLRDMCYFFVVVSVRCSALFQDKSASVDEYSTHLFYTYARARAKRMLKEREGREGDREKERTLTRKL